MVSSRDKDFRTIGIYECKEYPPKRELRYLKSHFKEEIVINVVSCALTIALPSLKFWSPRFWPVIIDYNLHSTKQFKTFMHHLFKIFVARPYFRCYG